MNLSKIQKGYLARACKSAIDGELNFMDAYSNVTDGSEKEPIKTSKLWIRRWESMIKKLGGKIQDPEEINKISAIDLIHRFDKINEKEITCSLTSSGCRHRDVFGKHLYGCDKQDVACAFRNAFFRKEGKKYIQLCGTCGDALRDRGDIEMCGYSLCECSIPVPGITLEI